MSIELHCPQCRKLIRASAEAGGKRGKCPYCKSSVYVPAPPDEAGEIPLAPIDAADRQRAEELRRDATRYIATVGKAMDTGPARGDAGLPAESSTPEPGEVVDLGAEVDTFVLAMRDSRLDAAEAAAARLKPAGTRARDYVQRLLLDEMAPQFENVSAPLAHGFLKALLARLS